MKNLLIILLCATALSLSSCGPEYKSHMTYDELYEEYNKNYAEDEESSAGFWSVVILISLGVGFYVFADNQNSKSNH